MQIQRENKEKSIAVCNFLIYNYHTFLYMPVCLLRKEEFVKRIIALLMTLCLLCGCLSGVCFAETGYRISQEGIEFIKSQEGFIPYPVWDNSQYSVGYGTVCSPGAYPNGISVAEAERLLRENLTNIETRLNRFISGNNLPLGQAQYDCLVSFTFNVGTTWLNDSRLSRLLVSGMFTGIDFASAIGVWCHAGSGHGVSSGLVLRRVREIQLFLHGDYTGKNSPNYVYVLFDAAGGEMITDIYFYPQGNPYGFLQTPEKKDTRFLGWYMGDGTKITEGTVATKNMRVTARWQTAHPASQAFSDITESDWYYGYVDDLYNGGVIQGYADNTIRPKGNVTVGEALKMILLACGYPAQSPTAADPWSWASGYRALALAYGFLDPDEATDLNAAANRLLIAKVAAKAMNLTNPGTGEVVFADSTDSNVLALYWAGIVEGSLDDAGNRYYKPTSNITRAEIFAIISRIMYS